MASPYTRRRRGTRNARAERVARGLGWFSIGVGLAQILTPRAVCRIVGLPAAPTLTRLCGLRELACGIAILTQPERAPWLKARVAGDVMDLAGLAAAAPFSGANGSRISVSLAAVAGVTALDVYCSRALTDQRKPSPMHARTGITVNRPAEELYRFWRDLQNLPRVMPHLKSVQVLEGNRSRWAAKRPGGALVEWESEIIDDQPGERLAWRSLENSGVYNAGSVQFIPAPAGCGTLVSVELLYDPPAGTLGASLAKLLGKGAGHEIGVDLRAFKRLMETGANATPDGQPSRPRGMSGL